MINIRKLHDRLYDALLNRGFKDDQIVNMTPLELIREYTGWHLGDPTWGDEFYNLIHNAENSVEKEG